MNTYNTSNRKHEQINSCISGICTGPCQRQNTSKASKKKTKTIYAKATKTAARKQLDSQTWFAVAKTKEHLGKTKEKPKETYENH
jgi:hypothetical protein